MGEELTRSAEDKVDETDVEWEYNVRIAGPGAYTPWQRVEFGVGVTQKCWGTGYYPDGSTHRCFNDETTDVGLCADCYEEIVSCESTS